ncbi:hypothetical protein Klosneuvirus_1_133 [Klosneuvirus KNV1]|uniref:Uncharacterized protein n=1 Tax=Klosneuvirus KNV1 TaxID=1977640 RepID=A0A1V0SHR8_9VIRU|nr:hypothetical protein Klosneuvirus_1_133 [Klosneuvirus KNV1]
MLNSSNIILITIISLLILFFAFGSNKTNHFTPTYPNITAKPLPIYNKASVTSVDTELLDDVVSWGSNNSSNGGKNIIKEVIKPNLLNIQFHNDYRDVIVAINDLVVSARQRFNLANIPLKYSTPNADEVKLLVNDFITVLNSDLVGDVPVLRNANSGWDEPSAEPQFPGGSGWDKLQKSLGLPSSLYYDPAKKAPVRIIAVEKVQKYETEDEIKYAIRMVIQKANTDDQMVLLGSFVQDKRPLHDENNFFVTQNIDMKVVIEDIYVIGYLSNDGPISKQQYDLDKTKYYFYDKLEVNNLTDPKYIQKVLMQKYNERTTEMDHRNAMLDEEGQDYHRTLPTEYDYSNIVGTRTIFDDMNEKKVFY